MGRLRARLDRLENHAQQTMTGADELGELAKALVDDLRDGITIEIEIKGFKLPFALRIDPREKEAAE